MGGHKHSSNIMAIMMFDIVDILKVSLLTSLEPSFCFESLPTQRSIAKIYNCYIRDDSNILVHMTEIQFCDIHYHYGN